MGQFRTVLLDDWRAYMQAHERFFEAEPDKHPVIVETGIGVSGHLEVIGALCRPRRDGLYRSSHLCQIVLRLFWTAGYVFVYFTRPGLCRHRFPPPQLAGSEFAITEIICPAEQNL